MTSVTLSRSGKSVAIPLRDEGGAPLLTRGVGKPEQRLAENSGALNPRVEDFRAGLETVTVVGEFTSSSAYDDAITLAELIKAQEGGTPLTLEIPQSAHGEFPPAMAVVPAAGQEEALTMSLLPGRTDDVELELSLTRVGQAQGVVSRSADIPTASGGGPIQLTDGTTTVDLSTGVEIGWSLGQPNNVVRTDTTRSLPYLIQKGKAAYEAFSINWQYTQNAVSNINDLVNDLIGPQLGRDALTLDFNGEFGLGQFDVVPVGSAALRHQRLAGESGVANVPSLQLRRVLPQS